MSDITKVHLDSKQFAALDLKLNGINGAVNRLSDNMGKYLSLIAQALSSDNPELQAKIDALSAELRESTDDLKDAVDAQK